MLARMKNTQQIVHGLDHRSIRHLVLRRLKTHSRDSCISTLEGLGSPLASGL